MYNFYQNNQLHGGEGKFEIGLYESFDFDAFGVSPYIYQMWFTLHEQGKILTFYYNTVERNEGMIYNMGQFLDLVEDLYLSNVSQPIHLPFCDFWMKVMFDFKDHPVWMKMWPDLEISPSSDSDELSEVEVSDEESEEDEEDGEWLESGDEDWVPESVDMEDEESEEIEEEWMEYVREKEEEMKARTMRRKERQQEKNAFRLRHTTYHPEEKNMRCQFCGNGAKKTRGHFEMSKHILAVENFMSYNMNLNLD